MKKALLILTLFFVFSSEINAQITPGTNNVLYVNINVTTGNESGSSWANALPELADALKYAKEQDNYTPGNPLKIYVAKGTYKPLYSAEDINFGIPSGLYNTFLIVKNVQLFGGFDPANGITDLSQDRLLPYATGIGEGTILSGDVNGDDIISGSGSTLSISNNGDNNYHIVVSAGDVGAALLDGFTITGGNTKNTLDFITINGINFNSSRGGGMYLNSSSPSIVNVTLNGNSANQPGVDPNGGGTGGAIYVASSSPIIT